LEKEAMNRKLLIPILVVAALIRLAVYSSGMLHRDASLHGSGTVEARNIRVGSKIGGRIDKVLVREGDPVEAGRFDHFLTRKNSPLRWRNRAPPRKRRGVATVRKKLPKPVPPPPKQKPNTTSGGTDTARKILTPRKPTSTVQTRMKFARASTPNATMRWPKRILFPNNSATPPMPTGKWLWRKQANFRHKLDQLHRGYRPEEIAASEARYRQTQATLEKLENGNRVEDISAAKAALAYDEAPLPRTPGPCARRCFHRSARRAPRRPDRSQHAIATLLERDQIYVRIYIPETQIGRVHLGQKAQIRVDSSPIRFSTVPSSRSINRPNSCRAMCRRWKSACTRFLA